MKQTDFTYDDLYDDTRPSQIMRGALVVVDFSAVVAILRGEDDADKLVGLAMEYERRVISTTTWLESAIVCEGKNPHAVASILFDQIVIALKLELMPFTTAQAVVAREAFKKYGKGRQASAPLNSGDCFAYALAKHLGAPLLFKGNDFAQTDIPAA